MGDYSHAAIIVGHEEDSLSPLVVNDIFLSKAYIFNCSFEELAPYLPWPFENEQEWDIFRIQNLTALLSTSSNPKGTSCDSICTFQGNPESGEEDQEEETNGNKTGAKFACQDKYWCNGRSLFWGDR
jgi:hypothetical protein